MVGYEEKFGNEAEVTLKVERLPPAKRPKSAKEKASASSDLMTPVFKYSARTL